MLEPGHRKVIAQAIRQEWIVFGAVVLVLVADGVLGWRLSRGMGQVGALQGREAFAAWSICLGIGGAQAWGAYRLRSWLLAPAMIQRRLTEALQAVRHKGPAGPERLTIAAVRSSFLAQAACWFLLQFIVAYGIVLAVLVGSVLPVFGFTGLTAALLVPVRPSARGLEDLALRLHQGEAESATH